MGAECDELGMASIARQPLRKRTTVARRNRNRRQCVHIRRRAIQHSQQRRSQRMYSLSFVDASVHFTSILNNTVSLIFIWNWFKRYAINIAINQLQQYCSDMLVLPFNPRSLVEQCLNQLCRSYGSILLENKWLIEQLPRDVRVRIEKRSALLQDAHTNAIKARPVRSTAVASFADILALWSDIGELFQWRFHRLLPQSFANCTWSGVLKC